MGAPFAATSPASTFSPAGVRVPVASVLQASDPKEAVRSPLLSDVAAAPPSGHEHHHHHDHGAMTSGTAMPTSLPEAPGGNAAPKVPAPVDHSQHGGAPQ